MIQTYDNRFTQQINNTPQPSEIVDARIDNQGSHLRRKYMQKTINFKNQELSPIINFLGDLKLTNKASRGRTKLIKLLYKKQQEMQEDLDKLRDQFFKKDDKGEFVIQRDNNGGQFYVYIDDSKKVEHQKEVLDIQNEEAVINVEEYQQKIKNLHEALENLDKELSNQEAVIYDTLMDKLEEIFAEKESE